MSDKDEKVHEFYPCCNKLRYALAADMLVGVAYKHADERIGPVSPVHSTTEFFVSHNYDYCPWCAKPLKLTTYKWELIEEK